MDYENTVKSVTTSNTEVSNFMLNCLGRGIEFSPTYKDYTDSSERTYVSFMFNKKNKPLIYAIVSILRLEGYEFSFERLNDKESIFNITDVINSKENTKLFSKLNDVVNNYDVSKNYYYELPADLQRYFDICDFAHNDNKLTSKDDDLFKLKYEKKEEGHKYTIKTDDERYIKTADLSDFKQSTEDASSYELVSDSNVELTEKLTDFNDNIQETKIVTEGTKEEEIKEEVKEDEDEDVEEEEEEKPELNAEALNNERVDNKFIEVVPENKEEQSEQVDAKDNELPSIDAQEISDVIYEDVPSVEEGTMVK